MSVSRIGHLSLVVTDLDRSVGFAEEILGLALVERADGVARLTSGARHHELELWEGERHACLALGLDVAGLADYEAVLARAREAGLVVADRRPRAGAIERSFWMEVPGGPTFSICHGVAPSSVGRYPVHGVRPKKLGHVTYSTDDGPGLERVLIDVLGFRLSDRIPGQLAWLRCNADHHGIGIVQGEPGLNHYAFELPDWGSIETLADHNMQHEVRFIWGPGRHGPGDNLFAYFEDLDGSMCEVFTDILQVHDESTYEPRDWAVTPTSLNQWGPAPDPRWFAFSTPHADAAVLEGRAG